MKRLNIEWSDEDEYEEVTAEVKLFDDDSLVKTFTPTQIYEEDILREILEWLGYDLEEIWTFQ